MPMKGWFGYGEFGRLARHLRFVERSSRRLARTLFHCMVRFGPKLEKKQAVLGRLVEIGAELLAISAACSRAHKLVRETPAQTGPRELADVFSRQARRRVEEKFRAIWHNDDDLTYKTARHVLDDHFLWLEEGIVGRDA
jgi:hypothetical protein